MDVIELIKGSLAESQGYIERAIEGLTQEEIAWSPKDDCNSIAFILWHVIRVEDMIINRFFLHETEIYEAEGWLEKLGTPAGEDGYRYTVEQLKDWPVPALEPLKEYGTSVRGKTLAYLETLMPENISEEVNFFNGPAPFSVVLGHVITEIALHTGQIAYLRGVIRGMEPETTLVT